MFQCYQQLKPTTWFQPPVAPRDHQGIFQCIPVYQVTSSKARLKPFILTQQAQPTSSGDYWWRQSLGLIVSSLCLHPLILNLQKHLKISSSALLMKSSKRNTVLSLWLMIQFTIQRERSTGIFTLMSYRW